MNFQTKQSFLNYIKFLKKIGIGSVGICFLDKRNKQVLKVFHQFFDEIENFYQDEHISYQQEEILRFSKLENKHFIFPKEVIMVDKEIVGYITSFIKAKSLYKQDPLEINLNDFTKAIFNIYEAIEMISKQGILTYDMMFNILYNQDFFIIDHDEYMFKDLDWQILNKENKKNFNMELFYFLIDGYFDEFIKKYPLLRKMYKEKEIDILDFLKLFRNKLSEIIGFEIKYLNEALKLINKKKTKTTIYPRKIDK